MENGRQRHVFQQINRVSLPNQKRKRKNNLQLAVKNKNTDEKAESAVLTCNAFGLGLMTANNKIYR